MGSSEAKLTCPTCKVEVKDKGVPGVEWGGTVGFKRLYQCPSCKEIWALMHWEKPT